MSKLCLANDVHSLAWDYEKPKPVAQAAAYVTQNCVCNITNTTHLFQAHTPTGFYVSINIDLTRHWKSAI
jgi:hypothetical protein